MVERSSPECVWELVTLHTDFRSKRDKFVRNVRISLAHSLKMIWRMYAATVRFYKTDRQLLSDSIKGPRSASSGRRLEAREATILNVKLMSLYQWRAWLVTLLHDILEMRDPPS